jgi:hypothetical protein
MRCAALNDEYNPVTNKCKPGRDRCGCVSVADEFGAENVA